MNPFMKTLKKIAAAYNGVSLILRIAIGLVVGVILALVCLLPYLVGMSGAFYLGGAIVLNAVFLWYAWRMLNPPDELFSMKMFYYSIVYLMALFAFLLVDHWILPWL